ncbi:MAG: gluconate 2-dehydrogenase subunit 3 family protein [Albidovulum sp.]|nr:gluconate 2-dehydrogenase subunit 3 family protein [Albidovulum sp.]MDE0308146.1 gluconate 2-dehydrogenase subunit 3 family protein [Albidovulum sp.]MDE0533020.1 gluconate 2-dehydrogenase subunit 3 family protein [Albidovulum sp.]
MVTGEKRQLLDLILDELVPPSADGRIPGAGEAGVAEFLPSSESYVPKPLDAVNSVLSSVSAKSADFSALDRTERVSVLKAVEADKPESFETLVRLTYMGYYSQPGIRPLFGVGAHPVHPEGYAVERESDELLAELTKSVRSRGSNYRA